MIVFANSLDGSLARYRSNLFDTDGIPDKNLQTTKYFEKLPSMQTVKRYNMIANSQSRDQSDVC